MSGRLKLSDLKSYCRKELLNQLIELPASKAIVWDDELTAQISLICEYSHLQEVGVQKMFSLTAKAFQVSDIAHIVFLVRPILPLMNRVASVAQIFNAQNSSRSGDEKDFHIIFVPHTSEVCTKKLKELGVLQYFTDRIHSLPLFLLPLDTDVLSMEHQLSFKECFVDQELSSLHNIASGLMIIQNLFGVIPNVFCKGDCAKRVLNMMMRMRREQSHNEEQKPSMIDNLIIIDRTADLLTPFVSQLTYEGLIDELFHIQNTAVKLPAEKFDSSKESSSEGKKKILLTSSEELYAEIRDRNFNAVGSILSSKAKAITANYEERTQAKTIGDIKLFVSKLPRMEAEKKSLATHTSIAELIKEQIVSEPFMECLRCQQEWINGQDTDKPSNYVEDCISRQEPLEKVLRLIAIQSFCNNGLKPLVLKSYRTAIIQAYGFEHMILLNNLKRAGIMKVQGQATKTFNTLKKSLDLVVEDVNEQNPADISYVYSGYAPITIRMVQNTVKDGWKSITGSLQLLPGDKAEEVQQLLDGSRKRRASITSSNSSLSLQAEPKVTMVFFIGGVTYAEIAALRWMQKDDPQTEYIIATTSLINGSSLISSLGTLTESQ